MPPAPAEQDKVLAALQRWAEGKATLKEVRGYSDEELYAVARTAYTFFHQGKVAEARGLLQGNALFLQENAQRYKSRKLQQFEQSQQRSAGNMEGPAWKGERKRMMDEQLELSAPAVGF